MAGDAQFARNYTAIGFIKVATNWIVASCFHVSYVFETINLMSGIGRSRECAGIARCGAKLIYDVKLLLKGANAQYSFSAKLGAEDISIYGYRRV